MGRPRSADDTRQRLLEAALELFTEFGFENVTVRDLCKHAAANLAAINYHFGDKLGLYLEVVRAAVAEMEGLNQEMMSRPDLPPGPRLRHFILTYVPQLMLLDDQYAWIPKLMRHEMMEPTPGSKLLVEAILRPRLVYLTRIVAELLGVPEDDPRVGQCVMAIQLQCIACIPSAHRESLAPWPRERTPEVARQAAERIVAFSLAGIEAVKGAG